MFLVQLVGEWLSLVEQYTHPTVPVELRQAVATGLGHLWRTLLQVCVVYITLVLSWNTYILTYENSILALELEGGNYMDLTHALSILLKPELSGVSGDVLHAGCGSTAGWCRRGSGGDGYLCGYHSLLPLPLCWYESILFAYTYGTLEYLTVHLLESYSVCGNLCMLILIFADFLPLSHRKPSISDCQPNTKCLLRSLLIYCIPPSHISQSPTYNFYSSVATSESQCK